MKINPPVFKDTRCYERFKQELLAWSDVTDVDKKKQGIAVALTLPQDDESGIREKVFDEMSRDDLKKENGLDLLIEFLDEKLGKDDLTNSLEKFENFEDFKREKGQSITEYISKFDQKYNRLVKIKMTLPSEILAFKLLRRADITREEKMLVLTGMDFSQKATLYDQAKKSLRKFKGELGGGESSTSGGGAAIKLEPAFLAENEEALWAAGYVKQGRRSRGGGGWRGASGGVSRGGGAGRGWRNQDTPGVGQMERLCCVRLAGHTDIL
jgi:hypothetical protein